MTLEFDYYFSFRSPYSYLSAPQVEDLMARYDLKPRMRIVTPIAIRIPGFFKSVNPLWPPYLLRDGTGKFKNEWLALKTRQEGQSLNYEILPFAEMPQVVNPAAGFIANANQDPIGTTIDNNALNQVGQQGKVVSSGQGTGSNLTAQ